MDILRFITAGSIDDGKSTLIGRLLYDTNNIKEDILESVSTENDAKIINLAHLTDGLRSERLQGITIDVAYKYFTTPKRKYIITDAPGHFQYTKNLVTGASSADAIIILIDAVNGITSQTRRHTLVASFLKISHIVVAVNKMDSVDYYEGTFTAIKNEYLQMTQNLQLPSITFIPMCALNGDNVTIHSKKMNWYYGPTLFEYLEACTPTDNSITAPLRFPVQYKTGNQYLGKLVSGSIRKGDSLQVYPQGHEAVVEKIIFGYNEVDEAVVGQNISLSLSNVELKRGDILSRTGNNLPPIIANKCEVEVCWMDANKELQLNTDYILRINTAEAICQILEVLYKTDNHSFENYSDINPISVNDFAKVRIEIQNKIAFDFYNTVQANGRGILIDPQTNNTSAAFVVQ